jgi:hypothetical protein
MTAGMERDANERTAAELADRLLGIGDQKGRVAFLREMNGELSSDLVREIRARARGELRNDPREAGRRACLGFLAAQRLRDEDERTDCLALFAQSAVLLGNYRGALQAIDRALLKVTDRGREARLEGIRLQALVHLEWYEEAEQVGTLLTAYFEGEGDWRGAVRSRMTLAAGHGTFVSGMVLMAAPEATILPIRVVDDEGFGTIAALVRGLKYAIDHDADVINLSVEAGAGGSWAVRWQLWRAKNRGIPVIASAGNSGLDDLLYLAADKRTIAVGAVTIHDELADFSNGGGAELLDLYAPGVDLIGPLGYPQADSMGWWSGTSFSAGIVSGAAALAIELDPLADLTEIRALLDASVDPVDDVFHTGRINLRKVTQ